MKTKYILGMILSAAVLFTGCKYDDDDLWNEVNDQAKRIAALEAWQTTVNSNIGTLQGLVSALENNDYVTGVTEFTTPAPGGWRITFSKSGEKTIWNGAKGDTGTTGATGATGATGRTPDIGVKEFPTGSGVYYWTLDGEFITDDGTLSGNKIAVRGTKGEDGTTPTVEIGTNGNWFINGADTRVKAKGEDGTPGTTPTVTIGANGNWFVDGVDTTVKATGNNGKNGKTPKVAIGSDGYWYISADGTATGTDPADIGSTGWTKSVKATGEDGAQGHQGIQGPQGVQGDAIFFGVPVDRGDHWEFTLAGDAPRTTITLPKYKAIAISYYQPGAFIAGQEYRVAYTSTGTANPTDIRVTNVPNGWAVTVDKSTSEFVITPPADFGAAGVEFGKATIWLDEGNKIAAMYNLELQNRRISGNTIGEYFYQNGAIAGVIYKANDGTPNSGTVMCLTHTMFFMWADINNLTFETGATDATNGFNNMKTIANLVGNGTKVWSNFPPFAETHKRNDPAETYSESAVAGVWYLPAIDEWTEFDNIFSTYGQSSFNILLTSAGGNAIGQFYWSSTEKSDSQVYFFDQSQVIKGVILNKNGGTFYVRGICRF